MRRYLGADVSSLIWHRKAGQWHPRPTACALRMRNGGKKHQAQQRQPPLNPHCFMTNKSLHAACLPGKCCNVARTRMAVPVCGYNAPLFSPRHVADSPSTPSPSSGRLRNSASRAAGAMSARISHWDVIPIGGQVFVASLIFRNSISSVSLSRPVACLLANKSAAVRQ